MQPKFYYPQLITPLYSILRIGKKEIEIVKVVIGGGEYDICENSKLWCSSKKSSWGRGLINTEDDKKKAERTGLLGEMAFSKISGFPINIEYCEGGKDTDFHKIDIKTATKKPDYNAGLIRCASESKKKIQLKSDLYVFGYVENDLVQEKIAVVVLVGGEYRENIEKTPIKRAKLGHHYNYEVKYVDLIPIRQILMILENNK